MSERKNTYDERDIVRREAVMIAGPLKIGAYRVRDLETGEFSELQIHMTYNNMVLAVLGESSARLLAQFVESHLPKPMIALVSEDGTKSAEVPVIPASPATWRDHSIVSGEGSV
jgi:hypothetical protein